MHMESGGPAGAARRAFHSWLAQDPAHRREYDRLAGLWGDLDRVPDPRKDRRAAPTRRRFLAFGAMGGAAACAAALGGVAVLTGWPGDLKTGIGERRTVALDDGSVLTLDADRAVAVAFTAGERRVRLTEGRAHFVTAPDPGRPFVVTCADGRITTADASFVVHRCLDSVVVAVESGTASLTTGKEPPLPIAAGQSRSYGPDGPGPLLSQGVAVENAWRHGRLGFQGQPLDAVIRDLNRYHPARIVLWDRPLAGLRFDGSVDIGRPDAALNAILRTLPLRTLRPVPGLVIIRSI
ncbi:DUF4880 domain-containing protein [Azospirillum brasilense]|nr:DUF4880 domain-containing protein [Azospirillum brasilense]